MKEEQQQQMNINLAPEIAKGNYSNLAIITHSQAEFVLDFAAMLPGLPQPQVVSRIIMNPEHAKRLLAALQENVSKYEAHFGTIKMEPRGTININDFNPGGTRS